MPHIKRRSGDRRIASGRDERIVGDRCNGVRLNRQHMIMDGAAGASGKVEITVIGHVAEGRLVSRRLVTNGEIAGVIPAVSHGHIQRTGKLVLAVGADVVQTEQVADGGFNRIGIPKLLAEHAVQVVSVVVGVKLIGYAVNRKARLCDSVAITANRVAHAAVFGQIACQIVKTEHHVVQNAVSIRHADIGQDAAKIDYAYGCAARVSQRVLCYFATVRHDAERLF